MHVVIHFEDAREVSDGQALDISRHGAFLRTATPVLLGTTIHLELDIGEERVAARCRVVRIIAPESGRSGIGVEFVEMSEQARIRLAQLAKD